MAKSSAGLVLLGLGAAVGVLALASSSSSKTAAAPTPGLRFKSIVIPPHAFASPPITPSPQSTPPPAQTSPSPPPTTTYYPGSTSSTGKDIQQGIQDFQQVVQTGTDIYNSISNAMNSGDGSSSTTSDGTDLFSTAQ